MRSYLRGVPEFQQIFVINLPSRTDHRDSMSLAAALTPGGLRLDYVGRVTNVSQKALPPGGDDSRHKPGMIGAWRAHVNVLRTIVEQDITSALVLEGDVDWDVRIKSQILSSVPSSSPYGDIRYWDTLWLGHCGTEFPKTDTGIHSGRVVILNDETVPEPQHFGKEWGSDALMREYPEHTRVVHRARMNVCSLAYGISQQGARRLLYELGIKKLNGAMDIMMRQACDGNAGRARHNCLTVQPQLFQHHRPVGSKASFSEFEDHGEGINDYAYTRNVRWSTRLNFGRLPRGETQYFDQWQDVTVFKSGLSSPAKDIIHRSISISRGAPALVRSASTTAEDDPDEFDGYNLTCMA
ncbi:glycosyltransferase family 25 protein [Cercospora zeae-maydis SCOH1-5]|uniref:Glycosyltransferase family 25 protein n=1 Tax=Cercospora zeae-maydis SCOH1-5 TaxID=717836 RepID=A0A6A6FDP5_9PEZI|nr:glycosyltransferase family 25 protein [Cercospora zeae-maydis SCOH1-5]